MRSLTERPSASDISVTLSRFGRKRRLVLMFEWLTLWPTRGPLPVRSQRRDMVEILEDSAEMPATPETASIRGRGPIKVAPRGRQVERVPKRRPGPDSTYSGRRPRESDAFAAIEPSAARRVASRVPGKDQRLAPSPASPSARSPRAPRSPCLPAPRRPRASSRRATPFRSPAFRSAPAPGSSTSRPTSTPRSRAAAPAAWSSSSPTAPAPRGSRGTLQGASVVADQLRRRARSPTRRPTRCA